MCLASLDQLCIAPVPTSFPFFLHRDLILGFCTKLPLIDRSLTSDSGTHTTVPFSSCRGRRPEALTERTTQAQRNAARVPGKPEPGAAECHLRSEYLLPCAGSDVPSGENDMHLSRHYRKQTLKCTDHLSLLRTLSRDTVIPQAGLHYSYVVH